MSTQSKYEIVAVNNIEVTVDVSLLLKSDELFFNATDIAKQYGKKPNEWLDSKQANEYMAVILEAENLRFDNLVRTTKGGKYQGTWLHKKLALPFARWLSVRFEYDLDQWINSRLKQENERKQQRLEARTGFLPLTNAIQAAHEIIKPYHFSNECNLINRLVTGMDAKTFKEAHGVESVRDALCADDLRRMTELQACDTSLIKLGFEYDQRKELLAEFNTKSLAA